MTSWKVFLDLQCPYSKKFWQNRVAIQERFGSKYSFSRHITSLAFHPQAFTAHCAAVLVGNVKGADVRTKFEDACFENQESYMNAALGDAKKSEIDGAFAAIAEKAGVFDKDFDKDSFLEKMHDWEMAVKPAYTEHKYALGYGVYGTPKHVIDEKLIEDTESAWGADEWEKKLASL